MIPIMGSGGAANLQREMTEYILSRVVGQWASNDPAVEIRYEGGSEDLMQRWLGPDGIKH